MFCIRVVALRSVGSVLLAASLFSLAGLASAQVFQPCQISEGTWNTRASEVDQKFLRQREEMRCAAENAVLSEWSAKLKKIDAARQTLNETANLQNWDLFKSTWNDSKNSLRDLQKITRENSTVAEFTPLNSLFSQDLNYAFQNSGLPAPSSFEDALAKIDAATLIQSQRSKAATVASFLLVNANSRGTEMVGKLARMASDKVSRETNAVYADQTSLHKAQEAGSSVDGYFGGFGRRLSVVGGGILFLLVVVTFCGAWLGLKRRQNPFLVGVTAGIAFLLPGSLLAVCFVFLPFLPQWLMVAATLAGTIGMYFHGGRVFSALAGRFGAGSQTGKRLRVIGKTLDNLRDGLQPGAAGAFTMATGDATHGSARWGSVAEMQANKHLLQPDTPTGFALARVPDAPAGVNKRFFHVGHVVTVAPTGSGKGIGAVIPNLLEYPGSALVFDVKGENAAVTARARRAMGHQVFIVDPFNVGDGEKHSFNLLDRIDLTDPDCVSESAALADSLVIPEKSGDASHFDEIAKNLLQGLMLHVVGLDDPGRRNLGEVRRLLTADEDTLFGTLAAMSADDSAAFGIPARAANTVMGTADRERGSILSTARKNTAFLDDPRISATLSRSDFNLANIKSELMTVYLVMPANRIGANARFVRGFVGSVISAITASSKQPTHRVVFLLDEFGQLGYMKAIEDAVSLLRGYGLSFWVFIQDLSQLKGVYPKWQTFLANSAKTFFGTDDFDTAKYISDSLGQATIEFETQNQGDNKGSGVSGGGGSINRGKSSGTSQQFTGRSLLTPDEVMRLGPEKPIVLLKGEYPYLLTRLNYLTDPEYVGKADANPYHN